MAESGREVIVIPTYEIGPWTFQCYPNVLPGRIWIQRLTEVNEETPAHVKEPRPVSDLALMWTLDAFHETQQQRDALRGELELTRLALTNAQAAMKRPWEVSTTSGGVKSCSIPYTVGHCILQDGHIEPCLIAHTFNNAETP